MSPEDALADTSCDATLPSTAEWGISAIDTFNARAAATDAKWRALSLTRCSPIDTSYTAGQRS
jgi:hypothetical protein